MPLSCVTIGQNLLLFASSSLHLTPPPLTSLTSPPSHPSLPSPHIPHPLLSHPSLPHSLSLSPSLTSLTPHRVCLRPLLSAPSQYSRDASLLFDQQLFLQHIPVAEWPFFRHLFDTQLFSVFIEQRSFVHAESTALAFFDECTEKVGRAHITHLPPSAAHITHLPAISCTHHTPPTISCTHPTPPSYQLHTSHTSHHQLHWCTEWWMIHYSYSLQLKTDGGARLLDIKADVDRYPTCTNVLPSSHVTV